MAKTRTDLTLPPRTLYVIPSGCLVIRPNPKDVTADAVMCALPDETFERAKERAIELMGCLFDVVNLDSEPAFDESKRAIEPTQDADFDRTLTLSFAECQMVRTCVDAMIKGTVADDTCSRLMFSILDKLEKANA